MIRNKTWLLLPILVLLFIASPVVAEADAEVDITVEVATEVETTSDEENLEVVEDGEIIDTLTLQASKAGEINLPWYIPEDTVPGTYTIKVSDAFDTIEKQFEIN